MFSIRIHNKGFCGLVLRHFLSVLVIIKEYKELNTNVIKQLKPFMKKYRIQSLLAPLMVILEVIMEVYIPMLMAQIVDVGITTGDIGFVLRTGGLMVLLAMLALLFGVLGSRLAATASMGFGAEVRAGLFQRIAQFSFFNIDRFSTASLVTRLTTDITNIQNAFMMTIRILVRAPFMLISATIMAFSINRSLVTVFLVSIPILAVALVLLATTAFPRFQAMLKKYDALNGSVQENLINIRVVKSFVREGYEKEKFRTISEAVKNATMKAERVMVVGMPIMQVVMYGTIVAILWFGGKMVSLGGLQTGELISFISYVTQILMALMMIMMVFIILVTSRASMGRISEVFTEVPAIDDPKTPCGAVKDGSIQFSDVSFQYAKSTTNFALSKISLAIHAGETIGIIGGTGSAKTTLVQLIPRFYDATTGCVQVGGRDVRDYSLKALRDAVSMVLQKNVLFSGTILENLRWGDKQASEEEVTAACKAAAADEFIRSFPDGYSTVLGQGGVNLSGGQKQRLCIARALLKHPKILILDDSTSAVDTATDASIRQSLKQHRGEMTTLIIAQRIASVQDADRIIVMEDGKIDGFGTHEELLATNEIYREVYNSQQKGVA